MKALIMILATMGGVQDTPQDIAKKELPKMAECVICTAHGAGHAEEKPAAGVKYKGKAYYFCAGKEVAEFKKDPERFMSLSLPFALGALNLKDQTGKVWDAEALKGKVVLLDYWATWCKPCLVLKPKLDKIRDKYKAQGFEVLSISIDEKRETMDKFVKKTPFANPVLWDDKQTWDRLRVIAIPALFLVKDGQVVSAFKADAKVEAIEAAVARLVVSG
ncbi:MAG: redoxin domain-containing protein [Chlorobia bacterium]|nr:redoxin domain-containing protein [Fimbriimonadaceae bacterium]